MIGKNEVQNMINGTAIIVNLSLLLSSQNILTSAAKYLEINNNIFII